MIATFSGQVKTSEPITDIELKACPLTRLKAWARPLLCRHEYAETWLYFGTRYTGSLSWGKPPVAYAVGVWVNICTRCGQIKG